MDDKPVPSIAPTLEHVAKVAGVSRATVSRVINNVRNVDPQLAEEFWRAFATAANLTLHIRRLEGKNTHHMLEASFKGVARCLRDAVRVEGGGIPSTKGSL